MRKFICILLASICCILFVACNDNDHTGEAKTPSKSSAMRGQDYNSVVEKFEGKGFTNIKLEKIEDLITGWLTKDGEVEEVSVGGDFEYSADKWVKADTEVIVRYHTFPEKETEVSEDEKPEENINQEEVTESNDENTEENISEEVLTIDNCEDLANILLTNMECEDYTNFTNKYKGRTIEFDGRIDHIMKYKNYDTRYNILVGAGDYDPNSIIGPPFQFKNVAAYDLDLGTLFLEDKIQVGKNVRIIAKVGEFNRDTGLFFLDPISVTER